VTNFDLKVDQEGTEENTWTYCTKLSKKSAQKIGIIKTS